MWRQIRDPDYILGALKTYRMMTGLSQVDPDFAKTWWTERLPEFATTPPFPTEAALTYQLDAIDRMPYDASFVPPDDALVAAALESICSIPLAKRAYDALRSDPAAAALPDWIPAAAAGPNGAEVLVRRSEKTLRVGIDGLYTYEGFHDVVLDRLEDVAAQAALDRSVFAGGCPESAEVSVSSLADDMLKLYYEDFIAQWDGFLHDVTLAPLVDLPTATRNLKDLSSADSALKRLLTEVVAETDLARPEDSGEAAGGGGPPKGLSKILGKLGKLGKLAKKGAKFIPAGEGAAPLDTTGQEVSDHFKPLKARDRRGGRPAAVARRRGGGADRALQRPADRLATAPTPRSRSRTRAASPSSPARWPSRPRSCPTRSTTGSPASPATPRPSPCRRW